MIDDSTKERRSKRTKNLQRAKEMRHKPVATEDLFWSFVRNRQLGGFKFKRQVLIEPYIADFVCIERNLIIELDGALHADRREYDAARDAFLKSQGYEVLRFTNEEFAGDVTTILRTIEHILSTPSPRPLPRRGRGRAPSL
jgi:very-short-patch-repair endonuclease